MKNLAKYIKECAYTKEYVNEGLKITADTEIEDLYDTPGVYAYFNDGYMTDNEGYIEKHKKDAIGVAVIAKAKEKLYRIVIDKKDISNNHIYYGGYRKKIDDATATMNPGTALEDMNGKSNTIAISDACHGYDDNCRTGSAAEDCQKRFDGKGYLPSIGEWKILYNNKSAITTMLNAIDGKALKESSYWSSTLFNASTWAWGFFWDNGDANGGFRARSRYARAVMGI